MANIVAISTPGLGGTLQQIGQTLKRGELGFALGFVAILVVLIFPMPRWLLDLSLAFSITFSVLILMTCLFIQKPLEFSSFPTILLVATMLRLSLNLASTRLILSNGQEGPAAAGHVIEAFGQLVMSGNFVIGLIVFGILVIVNFVVITKGSGRIAEVSARFALDAMPGKQMAIDSDLSAGMIDEREAKQRRQIIENESTFYGSMDGAAKFVRGDAIAGLLITFINIIGGIFIGVSQHGMPIADAANTYTLLTIGDGLVTQIPAIIVSVAAGMLVSKAGISGPTDKALFQQLSSYPKALGISSALMGCLALMPGIPALPFLALAGLTGYISYRASQGQAKEQAIVQNETHQALQPTDEETVATALRMDDIRVELGMNLLYLVQKDQGSLTDQIKTLRKQLAGEMGFLLPTVRVQDNLNHGPNTYIIRIKEIEVGRGEVRPHHLLIIDPSGQPITLQGEDTTDPIFGLPAKWIADSLREEAVFHGHTVVDTSAVILTHLTELTRESMGELLSYAATQRLLDELPKPHQKLIQDVIPSQISVGLVQRVLQNLLRERISIRDLPTIIEGLVEAHHSTRHPTLLTEHVRSRLARQLSDHHTNDKGYVAVLSLSLEWEQQFMQNLVGDGEFKNLGMAPNIVQDFVGRLRSIVQDALQKGESPIILTSATTRPYVHSIVERLRLQIAVLSQNEIHPKVKIKTIAVI